MKSKFLGFTYKDSITGFVGVATAHIVYLTGCDHVHLQPQAKDGDYKDGQYFDITRLILDTNIPKFSFPTSDDSMSTVPKGADVKYPNKIGR